MDGLEDDWRKEKLSQLRDIIFSTDPQVIEGIRYKMLSYGDENGVFLQLNAQKGYVSLYVGDASKIDANGSLLQGIDRGKGCLRFKKSTDLSQTQIDRFIQKTIEMWKAGKDIDC